MSTIVEPSAIDDYVGAVENALGPALLVEHRELVEDLVEHLTELSAEEGDSLTDRLGSPEAYAAELLASAGIAAGPSGERSLRQRWSDVVAARKAAGEKLRLDRFVEFRPAWWVLRAWAVVALITVVNSDNRDLYPIPDVLGNGFLNLVALGGAIAGSVWVAHRPSWRNGALTAIGVVGLLVGVGEGNHGDQSSVDYSNNSYGVMTGAEGQYIQNIWPFDSAGNPLEGVFLFDQDGNPLTVGNYADPSQVSIPGLFPQRQINETYGADGRIIETPTPAPNVNIPQIPGSPEGVSTTVPADGRRTTSPVEADGTTPTTVTPVG